MKATESPAKKQNIADTIFAEGSKKRRRRLSARLLVSRADLRKRSDHVSGAWPKIRAQILIMQYPFSILPQAYSAIERSLSPARLGPYLLAAKGDRHLALRLYIWNARLCEALYLPMQLAEVTARNAILIPVNKRFGSDWHANHKFINLLPDRMRSELAETVRIEGGKRGSELNADHVIAGLSFGFWVSLMTSAYDKQLWMHGVQISFPGASADQDRRAIHVMLDDLRRFRNEIAHHVAIFDRSPQRHFQNALKITGLVCQEVHWLSAQVARVGRVINERPLV